MFIRKYMAIMMVFLTLGFISTNVEGSTVVEFSEVTLTSPTLLDGTTYFEPYGLSFEDTTYWGIDDRLIGAGIDDVGIGTTKVPDTIMTVVFNEGAEWIKIDWLAITYHTITATAYDILGNELDEQIGSGPFDINHGNFIFSDIGTIDKITFGDNAYMLVGRLEFVPIPEPSTITLLFTGWFFACMKKNKR